jgi:hypothetical protein
MRFLKYILILFVANNALSQQNDPMLVDQFKKLVHEKKLTTAALVQMQKAGFNFDEEVCFPNGGIIITRRTKCVDYLTYAATEFFNMTSRCSSGGCSDPGYDLPSLLWLKNVVKTGDFRDDIIIYPLLLLPAGDPDIASFLKFALANLVDLKKVPLFTYYGQNWTFDNHSVAYLSLFQELSNTLNAIDILNKAGCDINQPASFLNGEYTVFSMIAESKKVVKLGGAGSVSTKLAVLTHLLASGADINGPATCTPLKRAQRVLKDNLRDTTIALHLRKVIAFLKKNGAVSAGSACDDSPNP